MIVLAATPGLPTSRESTWLCGRASSSSPCSSASPGPRERGPNCTSDGGQRFCPFPSRCD